MKKIYLLFFALVTVVSTYGQQVPLYSQYALNSFMYNPAYTADNNHNEVYLGARRQWASLRSAVETKYITAQSNFSDNKAGFGVSFINDQSEFTRKNSLMANYRYRVMFSETKYLSFGLAAGVWDNNIDQNKIYTTDMADPVYQLISTRGGMAFSSNAGVLFRSEGLHLGLSVPNMITSQIKYQDNYINMVDIAPVRHIVLNGQYDLKPNDDWTISPFVWIKDAGKALNAQSDMGLLVNYRDMLWMSAAYRQNYSVSGHVGMRMGEKFVVAYTYDHPTGTYSKALGGSHEIVLGLRINKSSAAPSADAIAPKKNDQTDEIIAKQNKELDELKTQLNSIEQKQKELEAAQKAEASKPRDYTPKETTPKKVEEPKRTETPSSAEPEEYGEFLLIAGSFSDQNNAMNLIKYLKGKGKNASYYFDNTSKAHYVYIGKYTKKSEAVEGVNELLRNDIKVWIKNIKK